MLLLAKGRRSSGVLVRNRKGGYGDALVGNGKGLITNLRLISSMQFCIVNYNMSEHIYSTY